MPGIVGAFPNTLQNGTSEDATQVMALFAFIQAQVNNNACPKTSGSAILKGDGAGSTAAAVAGTDFMAVAPGMLFDFAGSSIPAGYLACDGSAVSRTTYDTLFAAIGTTWGAGNGSTTFNLPDLRRRTTIGAGGSVVAGPGNTVGAVGGEEAHVLTTAELAAHSHTVTDSGHSHTITDPGHAHVQNGNTLYFFGAGDLANGSAFASNTQTFSTASASTGITGTNTGSANVTAANTGSGTAHNNMPPSAVVAKIIKT